MNRKNLSPAQFATRVVFACAAMSDGLPCTQMVVGCSSPIGTGAYKRIIQSSCSVPEHGIQPGDGLGAPIAPGPSPWLYLMPGEQLCLSGQRRAPHRC
jgi:hypothetical protein